MKKVTLISLVVGIGLMFTSWAMALDTPYGLNCSVDEGLVTFNWADVADATKYSIDVDAEYDTNHDGTVDLTLEWSFGSNGPDSQFSIPLSNLNYNVADTTGNVTSYSPVRWKAKVKALAPGKKMGPQNNPFSYPCKWPVIVS